LVYINQSTFSSTAIRKFTSDHNTQTITTYWCSKYYSDIVQASLVHVTTGTRKVLRIPCHLGLLWRQACVRGSGKQNSAHSEPQHFMTVSGHFQATVVLIPGKELCYPPYRRLCGSQKQAGHGEGKTPCPLSLPSNYSPDVSILHWYDILELYVIFSAAPHSRMRTRKQNVPRGVQNFRFFMYGYTWVIKYYRNITPYYQPLRRYEHSNIGSPIWP
jgi:hypothetical protein